MGQNVCKWIKTEINVSEFRDKQKEVDLSGMVIYRLYVSNILLGHNTYTAFTQWIIYGIYNDAMYIHVPDHDGGRPKQINAWFLYTHMVYL
jgi:hypothetical protein